MTKQCKDCGKLFEPRNPNQDYCCDACKIHAMNQRNLARQRALHPKVGESATAKCLRCGKEFTYEYLGGLHRVCPECVETHQLELRNKFSKARYSDQGPQLAEPVRCHKCGRLTTRADHFCRVCHGKGFADMYYDWKERGVKLVPWNWYVRSGIVKVETVKEDADE